MNGKTQENTNNPTLKPGENGEADLRAVLKENTHEFCTHSTLHGLKYVVDEHLYPLERIFFAISFVIVVLLSIVFISNVYTKWRLTPVIVTISPYQTFIVNEPFPSLTICNLNQASRKRAVRYREDSSEYAMLQMLCKNEVNLTIADTINWSLFEDFIVNISQPCDEMIKSCSYGSIEYNCSTIFRPVVTDEGLCCTFNMINPKFMYLTNVSKLRAQSYTDGAKPVKWSPEHGYPKDLPPAYYPRASVGTGETLGLSLTLDVDINDYYCSSTASIGVKIGLHSPTEMPHLREIGTLLGAGWETKIRIRADKSEAAYNVKSINKIYRQCYFEGEAQLTYFAYYNRRNCEMECHARALLQHCGCIAHYMPMIDSKDGISSARICGIKDAACSEMVRQNKLNITTEEGEDCQQACWPSCFDLTFYSDYFSAPISHAGFHVSNKFVNNVSSEYASRNMIIAHFYFKDNIYRSTRQTQFVGMTDFLSSIGGLMGLFMGFSLISIAEFFYYAVLRPYHVIKRHERVHFHEHASALSNLTSAQVGGHYLHLNPSAIVQHHNQNQYQRNWLTATTTEQQQQQQLLAGRQDQRLNRIQKSIVIENNDNVVDYDGKLTRYETKYPRTINKSKLQRFMNNNNNNNNNNMESQEGQILQYRRQRPFDVIENMKRYGYLP